MNIDSGVTPLVLLCPGWKRWGTTTAVKPQTTDLHSRNDDMVPFVDSEELVAKSGLPPQTLIEIGNDHRLADPEPLKAMLEACERVGSGGQLLVVRVMVRADSVDAVEPCAKVLIEKLKSYGVVAKQQIEQYWKVPELFELYFLLHPTSVTREFFHEVLESLGDGWDQHVVDETQAWAVWTPEMGRFCCADARWANVEYIPSNSVVDEAGTGLIQANKETP